MRDRKVDCKVGYLYSVFGLTVRSDVHFPELTVAPEQSRFDVGITLSESSSETHVPITESSNFAVSHVQAVLKGDGFDLTILNGSEITIHARHVKEWAIVRLRILGAAFGVLLQQRGMLVLHGATIVGAKGAIVLLGHSGEGKSTLTGQLVKRGYRSMGDDKAIISIGESSKAIPGFPFIKLTRSSAVELGFTDNAIRTIANKHSKRYVDLGGQFALNPASLRGMFVLGQSKTTTIEALSKGIAFSSLMDQSYRRKKLFGLGVHEQHFLLCSEVAQNYPFFSYQRSLEGNALQEPEAQFLDLIEVLIGNE